MTEPKGSISACIVCRNEADRLEDCLASLDWVDEIIMMDLCSEDGSADLAKRYGARIIRHDPVPIVEMVRNELAEKASNNWILVIDPDERISRDLATELRHLASIDHIDAVVIPRMNYDFDYQPSNPRDRYEPQLRMYRRDRVSWPTKPNALPVVPEDRKYRVAARDELVMIHKRNQSVIEAVQRIVRYAPAEAQAMIDEGRAFSAQAMLGDLGRRIYRQLIHARAWRDGVPGLIRVGVLVGFHFYVWAAFWQMSGGRRTKADDRLLRRLGILVEPLRAVLRLIQSLLDFSHATRRRWTK